MRVSFDLDDTLIMHGVGYPTERKRMALLTRTIFREPLRMGAVELWKQLRELGLELCIYTTSSRPVWYIKGLLMCYGMRVDLVSSQAIHEKAMAGYSCAGRKPSKHPRIYGIDVHIDDSPGVALEGEHFDFDVVVIDPEDQAWCKNLLDCIRGRAGE